MLAGCFPSSLLRLGPRWLGRQRRHPHALRVGVGDAFRQRVAPQHEEKAVLSDRLDE
jgi:hypothetical protein